MHTGVRRRLCSALSLHLAGLYPVLSSFPAPREAALSAKLRTRGSLRTPRAMADVGQKRHNSDWGGGNRDRKRKKVRSTPPSDASLDTGRRDSRPAGLPFPTAAAPRRPPLPFAPSSARRAVPDAPRRPVVRPIVRRTSRPSPGRRPDARSTSRAPRATPPRRSPPSTPRSDPASPSSRTPSTSSSTCAPAGRAREATTRTTPKPPTARRRRRRRSSSLQRTRYTPSARTPSSTRWSSSTSSEPR